MSSAAKYEQVVRNWAGRTGDIRKAWLFGSIVKGKPSPNDIDVAVQLAHPSGPELDDCWIQHAAKWRDELQGLLPLKLDLELFDPDGSTPRIAEYLANGNRLVYERAS